MREKISISSKLNGKLGIWQKKWPRLVLAESSIEFREKKSHCLVYQLGSFLIREKKSPLLV